VQMSMFAKARQRRRRLASSTPEPKVDAMTQPARAEKHGVT